MSQPNLDDYTDAQLLALHLHLTLPSYVTHEGQGHAEVVHQNMILGVPPARLRVPPRTLAKIKANLRAGR